jgi:hypothetical protein
MTSGRLGADRAAFTVVELAAIIVIAMLAALALAVVSQPIRHTCGMAMKDSSQIRGVLQGLILWSDANQDRFPLPSALDRADATVADRGAAKDTSANICSILVFNSFFPPELLVSPQEANGNIVRMEGYELARPVTAVDPAKALWDPAFRADFTGTAPGNLSYAHLLPVGPALGRNSLPRYGADQGATHAVIGNRGPQITALSEHPDGSTTPTYTPISGNSLTFLIHGSRAKWEGNIGYADNHVNFETRMDPESSWYVGADGKRHPDSLFFEETGPSSLDNFLGIFIKAGAERKDFKAIWD